MSEKLKLYAVRDRKVNNFTGLIPLRNDETARRMLADWLKRDVQSLYVVHCEDFDFYCLGDFDSDSGVIDAYPLPEFVFSFEEIVRANRLELSFSSEEGKKDVQ